MNTYVTYFESESGDNYLVQYKRETLPESPQEWLSVIQETLDDEYFVAEQDDFSGPGIMGTWVYPQETIEIV